jgi:hypothetical protein
MLETVGYTQVQLFAERTPYDISITGARKSLQPSEQKPGHVYSTHTLAGGLDAVDLFTLLRILLKISRNTRKGISNQCAVMASSLILV